MNEKEIMRRLLEKFRFTAPLPDDVRRGMPARRKSGLVSILRMKRKYGVFIAPVIWFFFLARRLGVPMSVAKCTVIVWAIIILMTGAATTGAVYAVKLLAPVESAPEAPAVPGKGGEVRADARSVSSSPGVEEPPASLGVVPFEFVGADAELAEKVTRKIGGRLIGSRGAGKVVYSGGPAGSRKAKTLLLGTVVKLGDGYRITARVVDTASSRILVFASEKISSAGEADEACERITAKVQGAVE
jgi:hypothetical protein